MYITVGLLVINRDVIALAFSSEQSMYSCIVILKEINFWINNKKIDLSENLLFFIKED